MWVWRLKSPVPKLFYFIFFAIVGSDQQQRKYRSSSLLALHERNLPVPGGYPSKRDWNVERVSHAVIFTDERGVQLKWRVSPVTGTNTAWHSLHPWTPGVVTYNNRKVLALYPMWSDRFRTSQKFGVCCPGFRALAGPPTLQASLLIHNTSAKWCSLVAKDARVLSLLFSHQIPRQSSNTLTSMTQKYGHGFVVLPVQAPSTGPAPVHHQTIIYINP